MNNLSHSILVTKQNLFIHEVITIYSWIFYTILSQIVVVFGVVANVINIVCFLKQGITDPMNISLVGLAVSDLGCLIPQMCTNIVVCPAFRAADFPIDIFGVFYLVSTTPHFAFIRVTSWITAIITIERCISVIAPLQVKSIVTSKRISTIIIGVFVILIPAGSPVYAVSKLGWIFSPLRNRTILGPISSKNRQTVETYNFLINNFFLHILAFMLIICFTVTLVIQLQKTAHWRKSSLVSTKTDISTRNRKIAKMVVMISALFISCFVPATIILLALVFEPGLSAGGKYIHIGIIIGGIGGLLESVNSSVNIFIYYRMSSKFRDTFCAIMCTYRKKKHFNNVSSTLP